MFAYISDVKQKKTQHILWKSEADEASSDITAGVPMPCALILHIALRPHAHMRIRAHTHTQTRAWHTQADTVVSNAGGPLADCC